MFHDKLWGGWHFVVDNVTQATPASVTFNLAYGGYQEAQGPQTSNGINSFYVSVDARRRVVVSVAIVDVSTFKIVQIENVLEELDTPGEWFYDAVRGLLYLLPNSSMPALEVAELDVPVLDAIVVVNGSAGGPYASGLRFVNITFTESRVTFLEQYEVPSGGLVRASWRRAPCPGR